jgi:CHASE1-domain containing sensor protein
MIVAGIILLLPGLCAIIFAAGSIVNMHYDSDIMALATLGLLIGAGGVLLIVRAIRGRR